MGKWKCQKCNFEMQWPMQTAPSIQCRGKCQAKTTWVEVKPQKAKGPAKQVKAATAVEEKAAYEFIVASDVTMKKYKFPAEKEDCFQEYFEINLRQDDYDGDDIRHLAKQYEKIKRNLPIMQGWGTFVVQKALPRVPLKCKALKPVWLRRGPKVKAKVENLISSGSIYSGMSMAGNPDLVCIPATFLEHQLRMVQFALGHETGHAIDLGGLRPNTELQETLFPGFSAGDQQDREYVADSIATLLLYAAGIYEEYVMAGARLLFKDEVGGKEHPPGPKRIQNVKRTLDFLAT